MFVLILVVNLWFFMLWIQALALRMPIKLRLFDMFGKLLVGYSCYSFKPEDLDEKLPAVEEQKNDDKLRKPSSFKYKVATSE